MFKRVRRLWELTKKDPQALAKLESLSVEQLNEVPEAGDGKAVFFSEGTEEDFIEFEREQSGMKGWYDRIKNL